MIFASDNWAGAHPKVSAALATHSAGFSRGYGDSDLDRKVIGTFSEIFEREKDIASAKGWLNKSWRISYAIPLKHELFRQLPFTGSAAQVPVKQGPLRFDRAAFVAKCHSLGLRVDYWVVDDPAEAARLLELGADGIMTNDPAAIAPLFRA